MIYEVLDIDTDSFELLHLRSGMRFSVANVRDIDALLSALAMLEEENPHLLPSHELSKIYAEDWIANGWIRSLLLHEASNRNVYAETRQASFTELTSIREQLLQKLPNGRLPYPSQPSSPVTRSKLGHTGMVEPQFDVVAALQKRRTLQRMRSELMTFEELCELMRHFTSDIRSTREAAQVLDDARRITLSYGSAFDIMLCINHVENLDAGIYSYDLMNHAFSLRREGSFGKELFGIIQNQIPPLGAGTAQKLVEN